MRLRYAILFCCAALPARAEFQPVETRDAFVGLIEGRSLTRAGVALQVSPGGDITGRAFGRDVTGRWRWQDGYFCRSLSWGSTGFDDNCQAVARDGARLRFTSDRGSGQSAILSLR